MKRILGCAAALAAAAAMFGCAGSGGGGDWVTLLDGSSLNGWYPVGDGNWRVEDGAVVADKLVGKKKPAFLVSDKSYKDFELHVEFWVSHDANSGIYMRCADGAKPTDTTCYEANIYDERPEAKYGTGAITHLAAVDPMPKAGGKWNTFDITVRGTHIVVVLNGVKTAEIDDDKLASGPIALQYVQGVVKFRKVQVRTL